MSLRNGIGAGWFDKYHRDVYPEGKVVVNGKKARAPKFYDNRMRDRNSKVHMQCLSFRQEENLKRVPDDSPDRLKVREKVVRARLGLFRK
jgi:hypothetical protein